MAVIWHYLKKWINAPIILKENNITHLQIRVHCIYSNIYCHVSMTSNVLWLCHSAKKPTNIPASLKINKMRFNNFYYVSRHRFVLKCHQLELLNHLCPIKSSDIFSNSKFSICIISSLESLIIVDPGSIKQADPWWDLGKGLNDDLILDSFETLQLMLTES